MSIKGRDKEFRTPKTTYVDFKHIEMDRVLTMLFPRLKYDGYASRRPPRGGDLTVESVAEGLPDRAVPAGDVVGEDVACGGELAAEIDG